MVNTNLNGEKEDQLEEELLLKNGKENDNSKKRYKQNTSSLAEVKPS